jgi:hypothetical protein
MEPEPGASRRLGLLRVALLVFFVALIVVVVGLLILPTVTR